MVCRLLESCRTSSPVSFYTNSGRNSFSHLDLWTFLRSNDHGHLELRIGKPSKVGFHAARVPDNAIRVVHQTDKTPAISMLFVTSHINDQLIGNLLRCVSFSGEFCFNH